jgi:hypothetical protein
MEHEGPQDRSWTAWVVVHIVPGLVIAGIAVAAADRLGGWSVWTMFVAGWISHVIFGELINSITRKEA